MPATELRFLDEDGNPRRGRVVGRTPTPLGTVFEIQVGETPPVRVTWDRVEQAQPDDRPYLVQLRDYADRGWAASRTSAGWAADELRKLEAYREEVREMRLAIVTLLETWDELVGGLDPGHLYLPKRTREILEAGMSRLRDGWGYDVVREDQDGAPLPDQPRDWREEVEE